MLIRPRAPYPARFVVALAHRGAADGSACVTGQIWSVSGGLDV